MYHDDLSEYWTTTGVRGGGNTTTRHYVGARRNDINIGLIYRDVKESKYLPLYCIFFLANATDITLKTLNEACLESFQRFE